MNNFSWKIPGSNQGISFTDEVLEHLNRHKQLRRFSREAGGQLFASISTDRVFIESAPGPYRGDFRCFFAYRSNPKKAQETIDEEFRKGRKYVGEWHTHREEVPVPSQSDRDTIRETLKNSKHPFDCLILVIQGLREGPDGLGVFIQTETSFIQLEFED